MGEKLDLDIKHIKEEIIKESSIYEKHLKEGSTIKANKASKKLLKIRKILLKNESLGMEIIDEMINTSNICIKSYISAIALVMNYRKEEAELNLIQISNAQLGAISMNASMALKFFK